MKKTNKITLIAILGALGYVLMLFKIPFPLATWLKFDISDIVVLYGAFVGGPVIGLGIAVIKSVLDFIITGSNSAGIGQITAVVSSVSYAFPIYYIYRKNQNLILGLLAGIIVSTITMLSLNYVYITPFYARLYNMTPVLDLIEAGDGSFLKYIIGVYGPFNLLKGCVLSGIYYVIHKSLKKTYKV